MIVQHIVCTYTPEITWGGVTKVNWHSTKVGSIVAVWTMTSVAYMKWLGYVYVPSKVQSSIRDPRWSVSSHRNHRSAEL